MPRNESDDDFDGDLSAILDEQEQPRPYPQPRKKSPPSQPARTPASRPAAAQDQDDDAPRPAPKPEHSPQSLELARYFGLHATEIAGMTPAALDREVTRLSHREFSRQYQERTRQPEPAPRPAAQIEPEEDDYSRLIGNPEQAKFFREREAATRSELAEVKKQLAAREESDKQRASRERKERMDDAFTHLDTAYYGEGTFDEIYAENPNSELLVRRNALITAAGIDLSKELPGGRVLVKRLLAAEAMLRPKPAEPEDDEVELEAPTYGTAIPPARRPNPGHANERGARGRYVGPPRISEREWANGAILRPSARNGRRQDHNEGHSGHADPDEFDLDAG